MTCESCCREFKATRRPKDCPHCGYNNGAGGWPRSESDIVLAVVAEERRFRRELRRQRRLREQRRQRQEQLAVQQCQGALAHA